MSNEQINRDASWVFAQDKLGRWLLHLPSGVVGKVVKVYAPGEYGALSGFDPEPSPFQKGSSGLLPSKPTAAVLGFEDGNAFLADPKNFQILTEGDMQVFLAMQQGIRDLVAAGTATAAREGVRLGCTPEGIAAVIRAALQAQLRALTPR